MAIYTGKINFHCSISVWLAKFLDSSVNVCNNTNGCKNSIALLHLGIGLYESVCKAIKLAGSLKMIRKMKRPSL